MNKPAMKINKISLESLSIFTRQMSFLLGSGISFSKILSILEEQSNDMKLKYVINELNKYIVSYGLSLSQAMSKFPRVFSGTYIGMIKTGEMSGELSVVVEKLADNCEKELALMKKTSSALVYPFFVCAVAVLSIIFILKYVLPLFMPILLQSGKALPFPTLVLINFTKTVFNPYFILMLASTGIIIYLLFTAYLKTPSGKLWWGRVVFNIPIAGDILKKIIIIKFCRSLEMFCESGISFISGITTLKNISENEYFKQELDGVITRINDGDALGFSLSKSDAFPLMFKHMIATTDESVELAEILPKLASIYELEVETKLDTATTLIEPFLIIFLGIVIGFIMLSVFLPLYGIIGGS